MSIHCISVIEIEKKIEITWEHWLTYLSLTVRFADGCSVPIDNSSLTIRSCKGFKFRVCSGTNVVAQHWGFFSVLYLLWIKAMFLSTYDHFQGPKTFTLSCWAICMKLKMPILIPLVCRGLHRNLTFQMWNGIHRIWLFCLFVFHVFTQDMETSPLPVKGCKFWPILMAIGHWGFFSVPHLL